MRAEFGPFERHAIAILLRVCLIPHEQPQTYMNTTVLSYGGASCVRVKSSGFFFVFRLGAFSVLSRFSRFQYGVFRAFVRYFVMGGSPQHAAESL